MNIIKIRDSPVSLFTNENTKFLFSQQTINFIIDQIINCSKTDLINQLFYSLDSYK